MKKIALLMPVHNKLDFTSKTIERLDQLISAGEFNNVSFSLIVVDDGSTDGTKQWIMKNYPDVIVLEGNGDLWWSGGINKGARFAIEEMEADYLLLWNNDIITADDYFIEIDNLINKVPENSLVGSKIYYLQQPDVLWSYGAEFNPRTGRRNMLAYNEKDGPKYQEPLKADWLPGMGTLVPATVIKKIGYWDDKNFPQYHGDSDFTYRARKAGFEIIVYPNLRLWNDKSSSGLIHEGKFGRLLQMLSDTRSNLNLKKNIIFYRKHASSPLAYWPLFVSYFMLFGGFFKWKVLSLFGIKK